MLYNNQFSVEIIKNPSCPDKHVIKLAKDYISSLKEFPHYPVVRNLPANENIIALTFCGDFQQFKPSDLEDVRFYVYVAHDAEPAIEWLDGDEAGDESASSNHWLLPSKEFHGLWESLIYDKNIKENLLNFTKTSILFSEKCIDANIIACNRLVLLHGPPGTGKTSLCKALAQKLSVRMTSHYKFFHLIEINSHSLFSKWFSESGKLVMKLFMKIRQIIDTSSSLVCVLIDEVESIAFARDSLSNNEPSDSIRVVNAVLTQLDQIRKFPNVLVLTTSNLTACVDIAFVDRADVKQFIGNPSLEAIYEIYVTALMELRRTGIILAGNPLLRFGQVGAKIDHESEKDSYHLMNISQMSLGLSGRSLRKIPFLAHAIFLETEVTSMSDYLKAMEEAVIKHLADSRMMKGRSSSLATVGY